MGIDLLRVGTKYEPEKDFPGIYFPQIQRSILHQLNDHSEKVLGTVEILERLFEQRSLTSIPTAEDNFGISVLTLRRFMQTTGKVLYGNPKGYQAMLGIRRKVERAANDVSSLFHNGDRPKAVKYINDLCYTMINAELRSVRVLFDGDYRISLTKSDAITDHFSSSAKEIKGLIKVANIKISEKSLSELEPLFKMIFDKMDPYADELDYLFKDQKGRRFFRALYDENGILDGLYNKIFQLNLAFITMERGIEKTADNKDLFVKLNGYLNDIFKIQKFQFGDVSTS